MQAGEGERLTLDAPSQWLLEPGPPQPPDTPMARKVQQGMRAKGPVARSNACTPAPTACRQQTRTACPKDGQPEDGKGLTADNSHEGMGKPPPPPGNAFLQASQRAMPARTTVRTGVATGHPYPHLSRPENKGSGSRLAAQERAARGQ